MKALFDTNILIDYLNGIEQAKEEIARFPNALISIITWTEVMVGVKPEPEQEVLVRRFLSGFERVAIDQNIAERAVLIRRETRMRLPDAIIRASAELENALLVSRNTKDFPESEPWVRVPYKL